MDSLRKLEEAFARFPGICPRQARRFVYYLLGKSPASIRELTQLIEEVRKATTECPSCHRFFTHNDHKGASAKADLCPICADSSRDRASLMVVARDSDFETIEKSGAYKGLYFILGGTVPLLDNEPEKRIRLRQLLERVSGAKLKEIILSLNTTPDGEHTTDIVRDALGRIIGKDALQLTGVTVLGRGLSTGAELEYVDSDTIKNALKNRA